MFSIRAALFLSFAPVASAAPWEAVVSKYCLDCHDGDSEKGGLNLEEVLAASLADGADRWESVVRQMAARQMPPVGKERPSEAEYDAALQTLTAALDQRADAHPEPGRTDSLRRMTRNEYQNAVRDLLAVEVDAKTLLPADQSSHGFDNITVGDLSPALLDRYISAAQKISRIAVGAVGRTPDARTVRIRPDITQEGHVEGLPLGTRGGALIRHSFPQDGEYEVRIHLMRDRNEEVEGLRGTHELEVLLDGEPAASFKVTRPRNRDHTKVDAHLSARISAKAGPRDLGVTFVDKGRSLDQTLRQPYQSRFNHHRHPRRSPAIYQVSVTGPFEAAGAGDTPAGRLLEGDPEVVLEGLVRRAYRGFGDKGDLAKAMEFFASGGMESALSAILVSPKFLFRVERDPADVDAGAVYALSDLELATRLSFFLWSSIPDEELLAAAGRGELSVPGGLEKQARRMLADPRSKSLVELFAGQWLYLRNLDSFTPDGRLYPDFDDNLRQAMRRETELLFESVMREDRSVLDLLRSDHTFLNERLAKHYGIPHVYGERFRRVALDKTTPRGGLLRHGSVLTVTSYATRTSPVLRGHWVLENLMGTPPPPPPPDVPALEDNDVDASLPVRERLAVHRENAACAQCHDVMDPLGFAFEHFDAVGQWREREGESPLDATGEMPDGTPFDGVAEFEAALLKRPELFARTLTEKLLTFALGRGVEASDAPAIRGIVRSAAAEDYRFSAIICGIVASDPFILRTTQP